MIMQLPTYYPARIVNHRHEALPEENRLPSGWTAVRLRESGEGLRLLWPDADHSIARPILSGSRLRITVALGYNDAQFVEVSLTKSGTHLGSFDIRYAYVFQPFELMLTAELTEAVLSEGIQLRLQGEGDRQLWIFDELEGDMARRLFVPHLLIGEGSKPIESYLESMASLSSLQPFGWLEGCVLDGLYALRKEVGAERADSVIDAHLSQYVDTEGRLRYEDLKGRKADGAFTTIEATLPLAVIVKHRSDHPVVKEALVFWDTQGANERGAIIDGDTITAEGVYTVAYPLAVIATQLARKDLAELAIRQALLRRDWLAKDIHVYLRYHQRRGTHTFRSWSRAFAWYMLGMTRTWIELKGSDYAGLPGVDEMEKELLRVAEVALAWRQQEGLWSCFLDEPGTGIETSGSAGIATALALGSKHGLLPPEYLDAAVESLNALETYLTPDGILSGVSQHNAGGMELQVGGYRVLSQMGMGLMAQLYAAVHDENP
jgi:unsaturated rhamnogalacturonyl hydrolase